MSVWVLIFAVVSIAGSVMVLPPLPFKEHQDCMDAGVRMEASILEKIDGKQIEMEWSCVEKGDQQV